MALMMDQGVVAQRHALRLINDDELRDATLNVFSQVAAACDSGDLVVLAARRLTCIYQVLLESGMAALPCEVVSDRVLDLSGSLAGRTVFVIDDSVIYGRTLDELLGRLNQMVGPSGHVRANVICVDEDRVLSGLLEGLNVVVSCRRSTVQTQRYSIDLARTMFANLVPYFTDFPVSAPLPIDATTYLGLHEIPGWSLVDTTSGVLAQPGISSYTFVADAEAQLRVRTLLGPSLGPFVSVIKLRAMVEYTSVGSRVRFVPLGLLSPLRIADLGRLLAAVADEIHVHEPKTGTDWETWDVKAQHRLLQMFCSVIVLREFWTSLKSRLPTFVDLTSSVINSSTVELNFGADRSDALRRCINAALKFTDPVDLGIPLASVDAPDSLVSVHSGITAALQLAKDYLSGEPIPSAPSSGHVLRTGDTVVQPFAGVFGLVSVLDRRAMDDARTSRDSAPGVRWLNEGLSLKQLANVASLDDEGDSAMRVSIAIDICNDLGMAVPTTHHDEPSGIVYRRYRVGENSFLGLQLAELAMEHGLAELSWLDSADSWIMQTFFSRTDTLDEVSTLLWPTEAPERTRSLVDMVLAQAPADLP